MFHAIQHSDLRCPPEQLSAEDAALKELGPLMPRATRQQARRRLPD
jgi:hypothetical protein